VKKGAGFASPAPSSSCPHQNADALVVAARRAWQAGIALFLVEKARRG
jgi:hypothetical protein